MITATRMMRDPLAHRRGAQGAHCARHASLFRIRSVCGRRNGANRARDPRYRRPIRVSIRDNASVSPTLHMTSTRIAAYAPAASNVPE